MSKYISMVGKSILILFFVVIFSQTSFAQNNPPVLDSIRAKTVDEGQTLEFRVSAVDPDLDSIILSAENVPLNATFIDSGNGAGSFTFNPDYTQADVYNVTFIASDGALADSEVVEITVNDVNRSPVLDSIRAKVIDEGQTLEFRVSSTDPDLDSIILSAEDVPLNATFVDSGNGAGSFIFNPDYTQSGVYNVTFIASDGALADSEVVEITVNQVNIAPVLDPIGPQVVDEGSHLEIVVTSSDFDNDSLTLTAEDLPVNAAFTDSGNGHGLFTFDPDYIQSGVYSVRFIVSDGALADTELVEITVNHINLAPVLDPIGPQVVDEGSHLEIVVTSSDFDNDSLILTAEDLPINSAFTDSGNSHGLFTFDPDSTQSGVYTVRFIVSDGALADTELVDVTVNQVNIAPVLDPMPPQVIDEGSHFEYVVTSFDFDGDSLTITMTNNPINSSFVDSGNGHGLFIFDPNYNQSGAYNVMFIVSDYALSDTGFLQITVNHVNVAPVLDPIGSRSVVEGEHLEFIVTATDFDLDSLVLTVENLPDNAAFTDSGNGHGLFTFDPDFFQAGSYSLIFKVSDGELADSEIVQIDVLNLNRAPVLAPIGSQTIDEGVHFELLVTSSDPDYDAIVLSAENLPLNASFVDSGNGNGLFVFDPDYTQSGIYSISFIASDGDLADTELVDITVNHINLAPVLDPIGPQVVDEGSHLEIVVTSSDFDNDSLTLTAEDLPANAAFTDSGNGHGLFTFDPDSTQASVYSVRFIVSDGALVDTELVDITVNQVNLAPQLDSIPTPQTVDENQLLEFNVSATDFDLDSLILTVENLPANAAFTDSGNGHGLFTFDPDFFQAGSYSLVFKVSDGELADSQYVDIIVYNVNRPPIIDLIAPQTVDEGNYLAFLVNADDPDLEILTLIAQNLMPNATFTDSGNNVGLFEFYPDYTQAGFYIIRFIASDGQLSDTIYVDITVNDVNPPPQLEPIPTPQTVNEQDTLTFQVLASDPDGTIPSLTAENLPENASFVDSGDGSGGFYFYPVYGQAGGYDVLFIASDGELDDSQYVHIDVVVTNRSPELAPIDSQTVAEGDTLELIITATDPDGTFPSITALNLPANAALYDSGNGHALLEFMPDYDQESDYTITIIASDGSLADTGYVYITVLHTNIAPAFDPIDPQVVDEGSHLEIVVTSSDFDDDSLTLTAEDLPANAAFTDSGNGYGLFIFDPDYTQSGIYFVRFVASDGDLADTELVEITVIEYGNYAPELDSIGPQAIAEGGILEFRIHATDIDLDSVILEALDVPLNASFVDSGNGAGSFTFNPDYTQSGIYNVTFIASDGALADSEVVQITVDEVGNQAPVLDSIGPQFLYEGDSLTLLISATDPDGPPPILGINNQPTNSSFIDSGNGKGVFNFKPDFYQAGIESVTFIATEDTTNPLSDLEIVAITIWDVNQPPHIDSIGPKNVVAGDTLMFTVYGHDPTDPDGGPLYLTAIGLPQNATFHDSGGDIGGFIFAPDESQVGMDTVIFYCTDAEDPSLTGSETVIITINEGPNKAPVLDPIGYKNVTEGETLSFVVSASDPDGTTPVLYASQPLPRNAVFVDSGNGRGSFVFTPDYAQQGLKEVTFYASDGELIDYEDVIIQVIDAGNQKPILDSIGPKSVIEADTLIFLVSAVDPDSTIPYLSVDSLPINASFEDSGNGRGVFIFTPVYVQSGVYNLKFIASDEELADSELVEITVVEAGNQMPVLSPIDSQIVAEGGNLTFVLTAVDPDSTIPTLKANNLPDNATFTDSLDGTGSFEFNPDYSQAGVDTVIFEAVDSEDTLFVDSLSVQITVTNVNREPQIQHIPAQSVYEGDTLRFNVVATDPDLIPPSLDYGPKPRNSTFVDSGNGVGTFTFYPDFSQAGYYYVYFIAVDAEYPETTWRQVMISVYDVPQPPTLLSIPDTSVMEGDTLILTIWSTDPDNVPPALTALEIPLNSQFVDNADWSGTLTFTPNYVQAGTSWITFVATDPTSLVDSQEVMILALEAGNQPPGIIPIDTYYIAGVERGISFTVSATDPDSTIPSFTSGSLPANADLYDSGNGTALFSFVPDSSQADSVYEIIFIATDGELADSFSVSVEVIAYIRGDANFDGVLNLGDVIYLANYLLKGGPEPYPMEAGDVNADGSINLGDVIYLANYLLKGGPAPPLARFSIADEKPLEEKLYYQEKLR